jgi:ABC-2 type transport system permease protein
LRTALLVAGNDLRRRLRDRTAIVTGVVAPVALAAIVGLAFGSQDETGAVRIVVATRDPSSAAGGLVDLAVAWARPGPGIAVQRAASPDDAVEDFRRGRASAAVVLPEGYTTAERLRFPEVHSRSENVVGRGVADALSQAIAQAAFVRQAALERGADPAAVTAFMRQPPPISVVDDGGGAIRSLMGYFGPAVAMVFLFFGIGIGARSVLAERQVGTLARLQAAPVRFGHVIAGKLLAMLALSGLTIGVIWVTTVVFLDASWGDPVGVVALSLALVIAMGSLALLVVVLARTEQQADAATAGIGFGLALLGGNFFPPSSLPPVFERVSLLTPNGWGLQGYGALAIDGKGASAVVGPVLALLVITAVFGTVAVVRFRREMAA